MRTLLFRTLQIKSSSDLAQSPPSIVFGPFNFTTQRRWKKPANTAQTRLESRTRDLKLDNLSAQIRKLKTAHQLFDLMSKRRGSYVSVQIMSRWVNIVGLNIGMGEYLRKYPHVFEVFTHPIKRNVCCRVTQKMLDLVDEEAEAIRNSELENVRRIKKLLMMSKDGILNIHALRLVRRELGLPEDFRESILMKHSNDFKLIDLETVGLIESDENLGVAEVEKWREIEYKEKWLSEFETKYAFPINLPTGFQIQKGFRETLKNWQRMPYVKPYEKAPPGARTTGSVAQIEKTVVGMLHEFLSLTVEKMVEVERFAHFRKDLCIKVNVQELLLKHPGIFYISTKGGTRTVFLREAYGKGCLVEVNPIYNVRRKMLDLMLLGRHGTRELNNDDLVEHLKVDRLSRETNKYPEGMRDGDWVIRLLERSDE